MTTATVKRRDPMKEVVDLDLLQLSIHLLNARNQDWAYWANTPVPVRPGDRVAFEELRQLAVFLPLAFVALTFVATGNTLLTVTAFAVLAFPMMLALNKHLVDAIDQERAAQLRRDGGRYAFTHYLCERLGLQPQEVTRELVGKMNEDMKAIAALNAPLIKARQDAERQARELARGNVPRAPYRNTRRGDVRGAGGFGRGFAPAAAAGAAGYAMGAVDPTTGEIPMHLVNPANGLPMMDSLVDVHGNVYGTTVVDDSVSAAADDDFSYGQQDSGVVHVDYNANAFGDQTFGSFDINNNGI